MKITVIDATTKKPLANAKIQLQVKGRDSGFLSLTTDQTGALLLDDKYNGQQIASAGGGGQGQFITATNGATLTVTAKEKTTTTTGSTTTK